MRPCSPYALCSSSCHHLRDRHPQEPGGLPASRDTHRTRLQGSGLLLQRERYKKGQSSLRAPQAYIWLRGVMGRGRPSPCSPSTESRLSPSTELGTATAVPLCSPQSESCLARGHGEQLEGAGKLGLILLHSAAPLAQWGAEVLSCSAAVESSCGGLLPCDP